MWGTSVSIQPVVLEIIKLILLRTYQETALNSEIYATRINGRKISNIENDLM